MPVRKQTIVAIESVTIDTSVVYFRLAPQKCGALECAGCVNSLSSLPLRSRRSTPAGQCRLSKAVLYCEALLRTALRCAL